MRDLMTEALETRSVQHEVEARLLDFVRKNLLPDEEPDRLDAATPLLAEGVIDSLGLAMLLNFIRTRIGVDLPYGHITRENFATVGTIAAVVTGLSDEQRENSRHADRNQGRPDAATDREDRASSAGVQPR